MEEYLNSAILVDSKSLVGFLSLTTFTPLITIFILKLESFIILESLEEVPWSFIVFLKILIVSESKSFIIIFVPLKVEELFL